MMWDHDEESLPPDSISADSSSADEASLEDQVLVAVVPTLRDWEHVVQDHWYRIPLARAPQRIGAQYLAFYHTKRFGETRWSIRYYAPIERYALVQRVDLLPNEPDHPRAGDYYFKIEIGPLETLPHPIPSRKLRRITFITTTLPLLLQAREITELWAREVAQDRLWNALCIREVYACRDYVIEESNPHYIADLVIPCTNGYLAVTCVTGSDGESSAPLQPTALRETRWGRSLTLVRYTVDEVAEHTERCVGEICELVEAHGRQG